jgi:hypothetical protein
VDETFPLVFRKAASRLDVNPAALLIEKQNPEAMSQNTECIRPKPFFFYSEF